MKVMLHGSEVHCALVLTKRSYKSGVLKEEQKRIVGLEAKVVQIDKFWAEFPKIELDYDGTMYRRVDNEDRGYIIYQVEAVPYL